MGTSKRYAHVVDARMSERVLERIAGEGQLQSLTSEELRLGEVALTIDPKPHRKVWAWVRFGGTPVRVQAVAVRWTRDAVGIAFQIGDVHHRCWVWAGAVEECGSSTVGSESHR